MWNPFRKNNKSASNSNDMGFVQKLAMKKMMSMSPEQREKLMKKVMTPENLNKNRDKILETMEQMKASGQMTDDQIEMAKRKLGL